MGLLPKGTSLVSKSTGVGLELFWYESASMGINLALDQTLSLSPLGGSSVLGMSLKTRFMEKNAESKSMGATSALQ
jgi:hypothetical protein